MKQHITQIQLNQLSDKGKERLRDWCYNTFIQYDDDQVLMYLPDEEGGEGRIIGGNWDQEITLYTLVSGDVKPYLQQKLKNYEGRMYPLLSLGQMIEFLDDNRIVNCYINWDMAPGYELADALWETVKEVLEHNEKES